MRVLVTGGSGFVGRHLIAHLDAEVFNVDRDHDFDIREAETQRWVRDFNPTVVFHLAAHHFIPWCNGHPAQTWDNNVGGTRALLDALGDSLETFVLASSAAVYGFRDDPCPTDAAPDPVDVYGESKLEAEALCRAYAAANPDKRVVAARMFNVAGPGDRTPHAIPQIVAEAVTHGRVTVGNQWPMRDYIHVLDVVDALVWFSHRAPVGYSTHNVGTGVGTSVAALIRLVEQATGTSLPVAVDASRKRSDDGHLVADMRGSEWIGTRTVAHAVRDVVREEMAWA